MHILSSLIQCLTFHGAHNKQKHTVLDLLAASGVVRPGHVEIRYPTHRQSHSRQHAANLNRASKDAT